MIELTFPPHECGMSIDHNRHKNYYETVSKSLVNGTYDIGDFENEVAVAESIRTGEVWEIQWYPNTPVGFNRVCAPTLEDALRGANKGWEGWHSPEGKPYWEADPRD